MTEAQILHLWGGKGGTGKTTLSAAFALNLAERFPKEKILLVSLEPVGSLSDLLKKKLSAKPTKLAAGKGDGGVLAAELDPVALAAPLAKRFHAAVGEAAQKGLVLSQEEVLSLYEKALSGVEELAALMQLGEWLESGTFDRVVVDGAPTSHLLRQLELPLLFKRVLSMAKGERPGKKEAKGQAKAPAALEDLSARVDRLLALLKDPARTAFHLAALAEPVAEAQSRMLFSELRERGFPLSEIVVNQVEDRTGCPACHGRRGLQAPHVRKLQQLDRAVPVQLVAKRESAPRGLEGVKKLAKEWALGKEAKALEFSAAEGPPALVRAPSMPPIAAPPLPPTRLIFFVGQGGVGKSSCAAAAAVTLTEKEGPVLLISTDKAHSLSEVLLSRLTDTETQVKGTKGLYARELDVEAWFQGLRGRLREKAEKVFGPEARGQEVIHDRELLRNLLDAAPLGIEELAALFALTDALVQERFKRIVVDPSPSTDVIRILELPQLARGWLSALHGILTKYRSKGMGDLADEVAAMLKHVGRFEQALATPAESRFVVVTRGEELAGGRTERLVEYLKRRKLAVERVLVNRVLPKTTCPKCENRRKNELLAAKAVEKKLGLPVTVAPALGRHPAGLRELKAFRTAWYALSATVAKIKAA